MRCVPCKEEFEKYAASGFGTLHLGHSVEDPEAP